MMSRGEHHRRAAVDAVPLVADDVPTFAIASPPDEPATAQLQALLARIRST